MKINFHSKNQARFNWREISVVIIKCWLDHDLGRINVLRRYMSIESSELLTSCTTVTMIDDDISIKHCNMFYEKNRVAEILLYPELKENSMNRTEKGRYSMSVISFSIHPAASFWMPYLKISFWDTTDSHFEHLLKQFTCTFQIRIKT